MIAFIKRYEGLWLFTRSPAAIIAAVVALLSIMGAAFAPLIASVNPYDLASFSLMDGLLPDVGGIWYSKVPPWHGRSGP